MTSLALVSTMACAFALASLLRLACRRRYCHPTEHLVTVVANRRLRKGLGRQYWIRCIHCDLEHGPYRDWREAWMHAVRAQVATRRRGWVGT